MLVIKGENIAAEVTSDPVLFYAGEFGYCFSNFSAFEVEWNGRRWSTSEHAFQAAGFDDESIIEEIATATSAHAALKLALHYEDRLRATWDEEKRAVMKDICRVKLAQHPYIQKTLSDSGDATLVEDSPKDAYWGRGEDWQGANQLGDIWMELRAESNK